MAMLAVRIIQVHTPAFISKLTGQFRPLAAGELDLVRGVKVTPVNATLTDQHG